MRPGFRPWSVRYTLRGKRIDESSSSPRRSDALTLLRRRQAEMVPAEARKGLFEPEKFEAVVAELPDYVRLVMALA